eukprot:3076055-Pyramimonas_sp.AAC.2
MPSIMNACGFVGGATCWPPGSCHTVCEGYAQKSDPQSWRTPPTEIPLAPPANLAPHLRPHAKRRKPSGSMRGQQVVNKWSTSG